MVKGYSVKSKKAVFFHSSFNHFWGIYWPILSGDTCFDRWLVQLHLQRLYILCWFLASQRKKKLLANIGKGWKGFLVTGIITYTLFVWVRTYEDGWQRHVVEAILNQISMWSWILCFFSLAVKYLNHPYKWITYGNRAVYCFYILHQTVIIVLAYFLLNIQLSLGLKFGLIVFGTFAICFVLYEFVIRRFGILRTFFGVRAQ